MLPPFSIYKMKSVENYLVRCLKNSGGSITVNVNPFHWKYFPEVYYQQDIWKKHTYNLNFVFVSIKFWFDEDMAL